MSAQRTSQRGITTYRRDLMGSALAVLNKLAQSRVIDRLGMRKPTERVVFETTKWARDSKILDIFEGTQQIQQLIVARRPLDLTSAELR